MNVNEYIRVINIRGEQESAPTSDEKVIMVHRGNSVLGNSHHMRRPSLSERSRVIMEFQKDLDKDLLACGVMTQALNTIAMDIVFNKQKVALACWCLPCDCHALRLVPVIVSMANKLLENKNVKNRNSLVCKA